jgi:hypothetical protein
MASALLIVSGVFLAVILACLLRFLQNTLLIGKKPPVFEDIPFVGGLLKFLKVRWTDVSGRHELRMLQISIG